VTNAIIDTLPLAAYASTRNQGWLHSGALYAPYGAERLAQECEQGSQVIREFCSLHCPDAVRTQIPAYLLMRTVDQQRDVVARSRSLDITVEPASLREVANLSAILTGDVPTPFQHAVLIPDHPLDVSTLIKTLLRIAIARGSVVLPVLSFSDLSITRLADGYHIATPETELEARTILLAVGAYLPEVLGHHFPWMSQVQLIRSRTHVQVLHQPVSHAMLIALFERAPHLVPFIENGEVSGATICIPYTDRDVQVIDEADVCSAADQRDLLRLVGSAFTGLAEIVRATPRLETHAYPCYKVRPLAPADPSASPRANYVIEHESGLMSLSVGKFTTAPLAARACTETLIRRLILKGKSISVVTGLDDSGEWETAVAQPARSQDATHDLRLNADGAINLRAIEASQTPSRRSSVDARSRLPFKEA
jgi:glycerol-3-phosphate dehydrogenase